MRQDKRSSQSDFLDRLRQAVDEHRIAPAFQPIVSLETRAVSGFEVLARWTDPVIGPVPPDRFIPATETLGLMARLTDHLIRTACTDAAEWGRQFSLAFNIAPLHFQDGSMPDLLERAVASTPFPLSRVQVEITETAVIGDLDAARATIRKLRDHGVFIALDDFGTGYSSLSRLQALKIDKIKIDASFVRGMEASRDSRKIASAIIGLGQSLGMPVIAEGVESQAQADLLLRLGCDFGQGYLFGRALPSHDARVILERLGEASSPTASRDLSTNRRLAQFETVLSDAPIALCFVDQRFCILQANRRWAVMLGRPLEEIVGRAMDTVLPEAWPDLSFALDAIAAGHPLLPRSWPFPGELVNTVNIAPVRDEAGDLVGLSLIVA